MLSTGMRVNASVLIQTHLILYKLVGRDPPAYRQAGDHADQPVRSGNAPYRNGKIIYYVCISLIKNFLEGGGYEKSKISINCFLFAVDSRIISLFEFFD
jgi:hypothetical protein